MENAISIKGLSHHFGQRTIYSNLTLEIQQGTIVGLLGKNGVGKTTLMNILMGFLEPAAGDCSILGAPSHSLPPKIKQKVGLLFEGHLAYDFMTIGEIERFYASFYPDWNAQRFHELMRRLGLPYTHRIRHMSEGQRSQVVLGLLFAQEPDLLLLDDYAMGLDAGYRRLFIDYLANFARNTKKTVFLTSHVIEDMDKLVDEILLLKAGGDILHMSLKKFRETFRCFSVDIQGKKQPAKSTLFFNVEFTANGRYEIFSFSKKDEIYAEIQRLGFKIDSIREENLTLEDAFIGYTGRY